MNKYISQLHETELVELKDTVKNEHALLEMSLSLGWKATRAYILGLLDLLDKSNELGEGETIETYGARCLADQNAKKYLEMVLSFVDATATALTEQKKEKEREEASASSTEEKSADDAGVSA